MLKRFLYFFIIFIIPFFVFSNGEIVHVPFQLDKNHSIYFEKKQDINCPLSLILSKDGNKSEVECYEVNGSDPDVVTLFFINLKGIENIIVLLSWSQKHQALNISGELYQVYGYSYVNGTVQFNENITNDPELAGAEGEFDGNKESFKYRNAASIKEYLKNKYN
jgi:WD40 repeat protein